MLPVSRSFRKPVIELMHTLDIHGISGTQYRSPSGDDRSKVTEDYFDKSHIYFYVMIPPNMTYMS